jgi:hypothetical protein
MTAILAALCLCPSAKTPPPIRPWLKTKVKVPFDRPVTERSKRFSPVFQGSNRGQFQPCFSVFAVRSAEGRNCPKPRGAKTAAPQSVIVRDRQQPGIERSESAKPTLYSFTQLPNYPFTQFCWDTAETRQFEVL